MELVGRWPYSDEEEYCQLHLQEESWMYFRSRGVITDDQLILGLGIQPEVHLGDNSDLEGSAEDLPDARGDQLLELQNPKQSGASSPTDVMDTHKLILARYV
jgi:hypothetical protein